MVFAQLNESPEITQESPEITEQEALLLAIEDGSSSGALCDFVGIDFNGTSTSLVGLAEGISFGDQITSIRFGDQEMLLGDVLSFAVDSTNKTFPKMKNNRESKCVIAVPSSFDEGERKNVWSDALLAGFPFPVLVNQPTALAVGFGLRNSSLFHGRNKRTNALFVNVGVSTQVSLVSFWYQEVKLLGALYDNRLRRVAETSNQFFLDLKNLIRQLLFRSKISIENIDLVLMEEGYGEKPAFKEFFGDHFGKDLMFFQPSIVAVGAAVLCCWLLKPVKDFDFRGDYEVGSFNIGSLCYCPEMDRSCCSCWRVDNVFDSSDYRSDGSVVYSDWDSGSLKSFAWRGRLSVTKKIVNVSDEDLMDEYYTFLVEYDEGLVPGDHVWWDICDECRCFICSVCSTGAGCGLCGFKRNLSAYKLDNGSSIAASAPAGALDLIVSVDDVATGGTSAGASDCSTSVDDHTSVVASVQASSSNDIVSLDNGSSVAASSLAGTSNLIESVDDVATGGTSAGASDCSTSVDGSIPSVAASASLSSVDDHTCGVASVQASSSDNIVSGNMD